MISLLIGVAAGICGTGFGIGFVLARRWMRTSARTEKNSTAERAVRAQHRRLEAVSRGSRKIERRDKHEIQRLEQVVERRTKKLKDAKAKLSKARLKESKS